jgi:membrane protease YdiL (CAAX protease family)
MNNPSTQQPRSVARSIGDIILYIAVFYVSQIVFSFLTAGVASIVTGKGLGQIMQEVADTNVLIISLVLASAFSLCLFVKLKWSPVSANWLRSHPWAVLTWAALLSLGSILPSEWIVEKMQVEMSQAQEQLFEQIMGKPIGYLAIGIFAPLVEELVFRGAILRKLLTLFSQRRHWAAIAISALIFGLMHGNLAQGMHAFVIGLLIGWMFYRTGSIIPGVMFHWVNNTVAYVMFNAMPQMADGKLIDLFHGDEKMMYMGLAFSLCIFLPSLFQLAMRMKK